MNDTVNTEMVAFDSPSHLFKMEMRKRCTEDEQEKKKEKKKKEKKVSFVCLTIPIIMLGDVRFSVTCFYCCLFCFQPACSFPLSTCHIKKI